MEIDFKNGKKYLASARTDIMLKAFFEGIASRPICYSCPFKTKNRITDLSLFDCWHFEELTKIKDDDCGYTSVLVHSSKGDNILNQISPWIIKYQVNESEAIKLDGVMVENSAGRHPKREEFLKLITDSDDKKIESAVQQYIPITQKDLVIEKVKILLYKIGILQIIKKRILK